MTTTSGNINSTNMVIQAYLNMTQDITQGIITQQSIDVNCSKNTTSCKDCIETAKQYNLTDNGDYSSVCPVCFCTLENIKMNNYITIDFSAFTAQNASDKFKTQIRNSLTQHAAQSGTPLFNTKDGLKALDATSTNMYTALKNTFDNKIIQQLKNFQIINVNNPNTNVINVDMDLTVNFLSKVIQQTKSTSDLLQEYQSNLISLTTQITENTTTMIISWMVTLFIIAIVVVFFIFGIDIVMDVFMLYAST